MTMHMMGHAFNTVNTSRRKKKLSDSQYHKFAMELNAYNKQMKKYGLKTKTLDEYISYRQGKLKPQRNGAVKSPLIVTSYRRKSPKVPSYGDQVGSIPAKPEMQYSGERKLIGIGTLHKSNMVPVFEQSDAEDIARMRR